MTNWSCDEHCLRLLEVAGVWLAALATFTAVLVSLALARRSRPKLRMTVGLRTIVQVGNPLQVEAVNFIVTNHSERDVVVQGIAWRRWRFSRDHAYQTLNFPSPEVPYPLKAGEGITFWFERQPFGQEWAGDVMREWFTPFPTLLVRLLKISVYTPTGEHFYGKIESGLRDYLIQHATAHG